MGGGGGWADYGNWANCPQSECKPTGTFIPWPVQLWRPNYYANWIITDPEDFAECTINAVINYCYTGNPSTQDRSLLAEYQWKKDTSCPYNCAQKFIPIGGSKGLQVFHVARYGPYLGCDKKQQSHNMCALFKGENLDQQKRDFTQWRFFQYGDTDIKIGTGCSAQIPKPLDSSETVEVRISYISGVVVASYPSLVAGPRIVIFEIDINGHVEPI
jgi:hypothetical protein